MSVRLVALLLLGGGSASWAVLVWKTPPSQQLQFAQPPTVSLVTRFNAIGNATLLRFKQVDADGDGTVSLAEMREGFGRRSTYVSDGLLKEMLVACAGGDVRAESCTRRQMESSLLAWTSSHLRGLAAPDGGPEFVDVNSSSGHSEEWPCGPSAAWAPTPGLEGVRCRLEGRKCVREGSLIAWSLDHLCTEVTCICEPSSGTKRLAKVGLMGAGSVMTSASFYDANDEMEAPQCGAGWTSWKIVERLEGIDSLFSPEDRQQGQDWLRNIAPQVVEDWHYEDYADTEVGLFMSSGHELAKGKRGKVCMFSWQGSRDFGDWKMNSLYNEVPFSYGPPGVEVTSPRGMALSYDNIRALLYRTFTERCCSDSFTADKLIISGYSLGAGLAELHAIDAVTNWQCRGKDLGAGDIAVLLAAPPDMMQTPAAINEIFSCSDPAKCLAGSVVTVSTADDFVGDPLTNARLRPPLPNRKGCRHPSEVYRLPCPPMPYGHDQSAQGRLFYCHELSNYVEGLERVLVGAGGWGSSCAGSCGDPNFMMQCEQVVSAKGVGCRYARPEWLTFGKGATSCEAHWLPDEERCDCEFRRCHELSTFSCLA